MGEIKHTLKGNDLKTLEERLKKLEADVLNLQDRVPENTATIVVFSGDMDKMMAAFIIAIGAGSTGMNVTMFFTFWGLTAIKKNVQYQGKTIPVKLLSLMLPSGPKSSKLSKFHMFGAGKKFLEYLRKKKNIQSLSDSIEVARDLDVKMLACEMTMEIMGIRREELLDTVEFCGVASYIDEASRSRITLFI
jgi:peroxiredoxin family protein